MQRRRFGLLLACALSAAVLPHLAYSGSAEVSGSSDAESDKELADRLRRAEEFQLAGNMRSTRFKRSVLIQGRKGQLGQLDLSLNGEQRARSIEDYLEAAQFKQKLIGELEIDPSVKEILFPEGSVTLRYYQRINGVSVNFPATLRVLSDGRVRSHYGNYFDTEQAEPFKYSEQEAIAKAKQFLADSMELSVDQIGFADAKGLGEVFKAEGTVETYYDVILTDEDGDERTPSEAIIEPVYLVKFYLGWPEEYAGFYRIRINAFSGETAFKKRLFLPFVTDV